jgi:hypothetical protein
MAYLNSRQPLNVASWQTPKIPAASNSSLKTSPCPNPPGGPNPVPTSRGGWGHEKPFQNKGVPNLTPWSQPFATHSCGRTKKVGNMFFYTKREAPPLGTPRLGPHPVKPLGRNDKGLSQPPRRLGPRVRRLGPGRAARRSSPAAPSLVVFALEGDRRMLHLAVTEAEGPQLVSLHDEHTDPRAGPEPRNGRDQQVLHPRPRSRHIDRLRARRTVSAMAWPYAARLDGCA